MRGNAPQASQVWLSMSPEDRMKFARGEGLKPDDAATGNDIRQMMIKHEQETGHGPSNAEEIEEETPTPLGASIRDLSGASQPSSSTPGN